MTEPPIVMLDYQTSPAGAHVRGPLSGRGGDLIGESYVGYTAMDADDPTEMKSGILSSTRTAAANGARPKRTTTIRSRTSLGQSPSAGRTRKQQRRTIPSDALRLSDSILRKKVGLCPKGRSYAAFHQTLLDRKTILLREYRSCPCAKKDFDT